METNIAYISSLKMFLGQIGCGTAAQNKVIHKNSPFGTLNPAMPSPEQSHTFPPYSRNHMPSVQLNGILIECVCQVKMSDKFPKKPCRIDFNNVGSAYNETRKRGRMLYALIYFMSLKISQL